MFFKEYKDAVELAYKQVLLNPNDLFYIDFLVETIKKYLIKFPENTNNNFITEHYYFFEKYYPKEKKSKYYNGRIWNLSDLEMCKLIQYQHQFILFNNSDKEYESVPKSIFTSNDTIEFISNKEALDFFTDYSKVIKLKK